MRNEKGVCNKQDCTNFKLRLYSHCDQYDSNDTKVNCPSFYNKNCSKKTKNQDNSYTFRGEINIDHIINDCIKDQKTCFVAIGKKEGILGISRQLPVKDKCRLINKIKGTWEDTIIKSFYVVDFELKDVSFVVSELPKISKLIKKQIMKNTKMLKKQMKKDWDNQLPESKVMVY